jgi:hypothetical protein
MLRCGSAALASPSTALRSIVYYDGKGVCYFRDGWSKFFTDYGVHEGWFLLFTRRDGKRNFTVCIFDGTLSTHTFAAWS